MGLLVVTLRQDLANQDELTTIMELGRVELLYVRFNSQTRQRNWSIEIVAVQPLFSI